MRWAIFRGEGYPNPFMAEPSTPGWTAKLEDVYWFDDEAAASFRAVVKVWRVVPEAEVIALLVAREFTDED
jgi:hypothetical protein